MGSIDFETLKETKFQDTNRLDYMCKNLPYIYDFAKYVDKVSFGNILNRHVFKFTKLREDLIFVFCKIQYPGSTGDMGNYCFAVNENSFWNRFKIFLKDKQVSLNKLDEVNVIDILNACKNKSTEIDRIELRITADEVEMLNNYKLGSNKEEQTKLENTNIVNNASILIEDFTHYNKRVWCYLFQALEEKYSSSKMYINNPTFKLELSDYKTSSSDSFYNPDDENYAKFKLFYE